MGGRDQVGVSLVAAEVPLWRVLRIDAEQRVHAASEQSRTQLVDAPGAQALGGEVERWRRPLRASLSHTLLC